MHHIANQAKPKSPRNIMKTDTYWFWTLFAAHGWRCLHCTTTVISFPSFPESTIVEMNETKNNFDLYIIHAFIK